LGELLSELLSELLGELLGEADLFGKPASIFAGQL